MKDILMMHKPVYPDYQNCLTNVSCSILKHFGCETTHPTLSILDSYLNKKNYKNVLMILYDGLGTDIIHKNLSSNDFLAKNIVTSITSVFPPTTAAATTSLRSGLTPYEHGWLGWNVYIKKIDKIVTVFTNKIKDTDTNAADYDAASTLLPYQSIFEKINLTEKYKAYSLFPFGENHYSGIDDMMSRIKELCKTDENKFIYAYCEEPDHTIHHNGTLCPKTTSVIKAINDKTQKLISELEDTLVIILADHGHIDSKIISLETDYPEFSALISGNVAIEGRACAFWVKDENKAQFTEQFDRLFSNDFILYTKEQVLQMKLFGIGQENTNFEASLGDYLAVATGDKYFELHNDPDPPVSQHAGITDKEMYIPLIIVET